MKLLKLLATGAVALAVSTSVMAEQRATLRDVASIARCASGQMVGGALLCLTRGMVLDFGTLDTGSYSDTAGLIGSGAQRVAGRVNSANIILHGGISGSSAAKTCMNHTHEGEGTFGWLPSAVELQAISNILPKLADNFMIRQDHPSAGDYRLGPAQKAQILAGIREFVTTADSTPFLSSTESDATHAVTVAQGGVLGTVEKTDSASYFCVDAYQPALMSIGMFGRR